MVAPSRLSRESTTRSRFSEQKGQRISGLVARAAPLSLGAQRDVEVQEELLQAGGVLDVDLEVAHGVHHPMLVVFHLEADEEAAGALEVAAPQGHLDGPGELAAAVGGGGSGSRPDGGRGRRL